MVYQIYSHTPLSVTFYWIITAPARFCYAILYSSISLITPALSARVSLISPLCAIAVFSRSRGRPLNMLRHPPRVWERNSIAMCCHALFLFWFFLFLHARYRTLSVIVSLWLGISWRFISWERVLLLCCGRWWITEIARSCVSPSGLSGEWIWFHLLRFSCTFPPISSKQTNKLRFRTHTTSSNIVILSWYLVLLSALHLEDDISFCFSVFSFLCDHLILQCKLVYAIR